MIALTRSEELEDLLLWDFVIDPRFCMADRPTHPPRPKQPKTVEERPIAMGRDLADLKCKTEEELSRLTSSIKDLKKAINALAAQVEILASKKGFWRKFWVERNWTVGAVLSGIAIALTLTASIGGCTYFLAGVIIDKHIESKLAPVNKGLDDTSERLNGVDKAIAGINPKLEDLDELVKVMLGDRIKNAARLLPEEFKRALPDLEQDLSVAKRHGVKIPDGTLTTIRHKFLPVASTERLPYFGRRQPQLLTTRPQVLHHLRCRTA
jgi:hypothetical protein